jgi:hypothetical protein
VGKIALLLGCLPFIFVAVITFLIAVSPLIGYSPIFGGSISPGQTWWSISNFSWLTPYSSLAEAPLPEFA